MFALWLALFVACLHLTQAHFNSPNFPNGTNVTTVSFDNGNFNVSWMYNQSLDQLYFAVDVNTTGWVGFGFSFTPEHMLNYDVVVGGRTIGGQNYFNDFYTRAIGRPTLDAEQSYSLEEVAEENGITSLRFSRLRNTSDIQDIQFNLTTQVYLVWAYHDSEDIRSPTMFGKHTRSNYTMEPLQIVIPGMNVSETTEPPTTMTTRPPSSGFQLGVSFLSICLATILSVFVR